MLGHLSDVVVVALDVPILHSRRARKHLNERRAKNWESVSLLRLSCLSKHHQELLSPVWEHLECKILGKIETAITVLQQVSCHYWDI